MDIKVNQAAPVTAAAGGCESGIGRYFQIYTGQQYCGGRAAGAFKLHDGRDYQTGR